MSDLGIGTLQVLDPDDLALGTETVLFDCHDELGSSTPGHVSTLVREFLLGDVDVQPASGSVDQHISEDVPEISYDVGETSQMGWAQRFFFAQGNTANYDNIVLAAGTLGRLLLAGGVMKWVPQGSSRTRYIYYDPSPVPALLQSPESMRRMFQQQDSGPGVLVDVTRRRVMRGAKIDGTVNQLFNGGLLLDGDANGRPDGWVWDSNPSAEIIDNDKEAYRFTFSAAATRAFQSWVSTAAAGQTWAGQVELMAALGGSYVVLRIEYIGADRSTVLATSDSASIAVPTSFPTDPFATPALSLTAAAAPASTAYVRLTFRITTPDATARKFWIRRGMLCQGAPAVYRSPQQAVSNDPQAYRADTGPTPPVALVATGTGNVTAGAHTYVLVLVMADGTVGAISAASSSLTNDGTHKQSTVDVTGPFTTAGNRFVGYDIYRTKAGGSTYFFLARVNATVTSYTDNTSDANLGVALPDRNTTGGVGGRLIPIYIQGDTPVLAELDITPDDVVAPSTVQITDVSVARLISQGVQGKHKLAQLLQPATLLLQAEAATAGTNTAHTQDVAASGLIGTGAAVVCTMGSNPTVMDWRLRWDITDASILAALVEGGEYEVMFRGRDDISDSVFYLQVRHGLAASTVTESRDEVKWDVSDNPNHNTLVGGSMFEQPIGRIQVPQGATLDGLRIELWARREDQPGGGGATAQLYIDYLYLRPTSRTATLSAPTNEMQVWLGRQLVTPTSPGTLTAGSVRDDTLVLSANNNAGGTPPNAGIDLGANPQYIEFDNTLEEADGAGTKVGEIRVRNVTDGANTVTRKLVPDANRVRTRSTTVVRFTPAAGKKYQLQVVDMDATAGHKVRSQRIVRRDQPLVTTLHTDPGRQRADSQAAGGISGAKRFEMDVRGPVPMVLEPGLNLLYVSLADLPVVGQDPPVLHTRMDRYATVTVSYSPGFFH